MIGGIIDQTGGEELASVLESGGITDEGPEASADLDRATKVSDDLRGSASGLRTASILMTSWPGRCRNTCSRISKGISARPSTDANMKLEGG